MWIFLWVKCSWHACFLWDKPGWLNWFWQFLCEEPSSFNSKGFCYYLDDVILRMSPLTIITIFFDSPRKLVNCSKLWQCSVNVWAIRLVARKNQYVDVWETGWIFANEWKLSTVYWKNGSVFYHHWHSRGTMKKPF